MISSDRVQVWQDAEPDKDGRGLNRQLRISLRYLDEPEFTQDQLKAIHEIIDSFLLTNRQRARNRRNAERRRKEDRHGST